MTSSNCLNFLAQYADTLNAVNGTNTGVRPHPILFSGINCTGTPWPPTSDEPIANEIFGNATGTSSFGSIYIPPLWQVRLFSQPGGGGNNVILPYDETKFLPIVNSLPVLITDTSSIFYTFGPSVENNVASSYITPPTVNQQPYTAADWQLDMCMNRISTVIGAQHLTSWQIGSPECDRFMDGYCLPVSQLTCVPGTTEIAPLTTNTECVCLVEQNCLRDTFCETGTTNPNCTGTKQAFALFVPVTCFGKQCSVSGYRWSYMNQQRCTVTLCEQIISIVGESIVVSGGSTLFCGNFSIPIPTTTVSPPPVTETSEVLPVYAWVLIGIAVFIVSIAGPLSYLIYRQAKKRREAEALEDQIPT